MDHSPLRSRIGQPSSNDPFARLIAEILRSPADTALPTGASGVGRTSEALEGSNGSDGQLQGGGLPALTIRQVAAPTCAGLNSDAVEPLPSWPLNPQPQQWSVASVCTPQEWKPPADTDVQVPPTSVGEPWFVV